MSQAAVALFINVVGLAFSGVTAFRLSRRGWGAGAFVLVVFAALYFVPGMYLTARGALGDPYRIDFVANASLRVDNDALVALLPLLFALVFAVSYRIAVPPTESDRRLVARETNLLGRPLSLPWVMGIVIGCAGFWGLVNYANQYGGFVEAAAAATFVRAGAGKDYQIGDSVYSYRFADVSFVVLALAASASTWKGKALAIVLSLPFFLYVAALAKGKANLLALVVVPFIYASLVRRKRLGRMALALGTTAVLAVPALQYLLFGDGQGSDGGGPDVAGETVVRYLAHPYVSTAAALQSERRPVYLNDFAAGLGGQLLPTSWLAQVAPYSTIEINSEVITGTFERNIPPGPVAFGFYSGGLVGLVLWAILLAMVCATVDRAVVDMRDNRSAGFVLSCLVFTLSNGVYHGVPEYTFYFHRIVVCVAFLWIGYKRVRDGEMVVGAVLRPAMPRTEPRAGAAP